MEDRYEEESKRLNFPVFPDITDIRIMRPVGTHCVVTVWSRSYYLGLPMSAREDVGSPELGNRMNRYHMQQGSTELLNSLTVDRLGCRP